MMKKKFIKITILLSAFISLLTAKANAQTALDYYVLPMNTQVPIGEKMTLRLQYHDQDFHAQNGANTYITGAIPIWAILGSENNMGSVKSDLSGFSAVYTAPEKIPKTNPVILSVKFKANDTSKEVVTILCRMHIVDPGQHWFFAYVCYKESKETIKSSFRDLTKTTKAVGSASMLLDATPPEKNGYVLVNTEQGDKAINTKVNGFYNYHEDDIRKAPNGNTEERDLRNYAGTPEQSQGLLFEYDPSLKGFKGGIQSAGISFDVTGTDEFWREDVNSGKLKKTINKVSEKNSDGVGLGSNDDNIKKIKNGFSIDFNQSKDSSYTDIEGAKHSIQSKKQYHAVLLWVNKELKN